MMNKAIEECDKTNLSYSAQSLQKWDRPTDMSDKSVYCQSDRNLIRPR